MQTFNSRNKIFDQEEYLILRYQMRCTMQEYADAVRRHVCSVCIDGMFNATGEFERCGLPSGRACPIESYLPEVIKIVESIDSPWMEDYVEELRQTVCNHCNQTPAGICDLRLKAECSLDTYFMLVAEAVEEVRDRHRSAGFIHSH